MHSNTYYLVRNITRFLVQGAIVLIIFFGIHALASNIFAAVLGSIALWFVYAAIVKKQETTRS